LTGRTCASFDSIAFHWVTDNRDVDNVVYDDRLMAMSELDRAKLPDLVPPGTVIGTLIAPAAGGCCSPHG
jgi:xylulokinase